MLARPLFLSLSVLASTAPVALAVFTGTTCGVQTNTCPGPASPNSEFQGLVCTDTWGILDTVELGGSENGFYTPADCAVACAQHSVFAFRYFVDDGGPTDSVCKCGSDLVDVDYSHPINCDKLYAFILYARPAPAQPEGSAVNKRRLEAAIRKRMDEDTSLCPRNLSACRVEGSVDGYECIDTQTELESCGGCRYGLFSRTSKDAQSTLSLDSGSPGFDCSDRKQFAPGMTCKRGACIPTYRS